MRPPILHFLEGFLSRHFGPNVPPTIEIHLIHCEFMQQTKHCICLNNYSTQLAYLRLILYVNWYILFVFVCSIYGCLGNKIDFSQQWIDLFKNLFIEYKYINWKRLNYVISLEHSLLHRSGAQQNKRMSSKIEKDSFRLKIFNV